MRFRARPALAIGLLLALLFGGGAYLSYLASTHAVPQRGGSAVEGLVVDGALSLLPPFAGDTINSRDVASLLYRGLTRTGPDGRPQAELAKSWEVDPTSRVYTLHLRPGLHWSDGAALTSADAVYTLSLLQSPVLSQAPLGQAWQGVKLDAPDPLTIVYTLSTPSAPFLNLTSLGLVPAHALQALPVESLRASVDAPTSGPFMVGEVQRDRLRLVRNRYSPEQPYLDELDLRLFGSESQAVTALLGGQIDILAGLLPDDAQAISARAGRRVLASQSYSYVQLLLNQKQPTFADAAVRRAIAVAVDRSRLVREPLRGHARVDNTPIPPAISWATSAGGGPVLDRGLAAKLLDGAGWILPTAGGFRQKGGAKLEFHLAAGDVEPYRTVARMLSKDLASVGISAIVDIVPQARLVAEVLDGRDFDTVLTPVDNGPDPDIFVFWHSSEAAAGGFNFSGMPKNAFLDKDLEDGRFNFDPRTRQQAYADAQRIIRETNPSVFLFSPDVLLGLTNRLQGVRLYAGVETTGRYEFAQDWYVRSARVKG